MTDQEDFPSKRLRPQELVSAAKEALHIMAHSKEMMAAAGIEAAGPGERLGAEVERQHDVGDGQDELEGQTIVRTD